MKPFTRISVSILFALVCSVMVSSCCKDKNPNMDGCQSEAPVNLGLFKLDSIKPYFYFKPGSWWVYENDSTLEIDSTVMISSDFSILHGEGRVRSYDYESFTTRTKSSLKNSVVEIYNMGSNPDLVEWDFHLIWNRVKSGGQGGFEGPFPCFNFPLELDLDVGGCFFRAHLDSIVVKNNIYKDILVFETKHDPTWPGSKIPTTNYGSSTYYYARNIGIVAIKNTDDDLRFSDRRSITQTWRLVKYHID